MSYKALNWAWEADLPIAQKFVLVALADMADENESCYPGQERLARMTGTSVSTVRRAVKALEDAEYLSRQVRRGADGLRTSDRYLLNVYRSDCSVVVTGQSEQGHRSIRPDVTGHGEGVTPREPLEEHPDTSTKGDGFAEFYLSYPRKVGKEAARRAFAKAVKSTSAEQIIAGARRFAADPNLPEKRFIPHPATWLNAGRWDDEALPERGDRRSDDDFGQNEWMYSA